MTHPWPLALLILFGSAISYAEATPPQTHFVLESNEFPLGMFSTDTPGAMDQVAKMGLTHVHTYNLGSGTSPELIARDLAYMDEAQARNLKVMYSLQGDRWVGKKDGLAEMLTLVEAVKDHPALGFWYFYDEPDGAFQPEELLPFYTALKKATPKIPVAIAAAWTKNWYGFNDSLDILMIDTYPVQHKPFPNSKLSMMTRFTDNAINLGKPVMPINQSMNWKVMAGDKEIYRGSPVSEMRFPTQTEIRYWCFSGAAQGVRGMFWWSHARSIQAGSSWINGEFAQATREFREFTDLTTPTHTPIIFNKAREKNILMALWKRPNGTYLVAVNGTSTPQSLNQSLEDEIAEATLQPWGSTRTSNAQIHKGHLTGATAQPWEVFVWKVSDIH